MQWLSWAPVQGTWMKKISFGILFREKAVPNIKTDQDKNSLSTQELLKSSNCATIQSFTETSLEYSTASYGFICKPWRANSKSFKTNKLHLLITIFSHFQRLEMLHELEGFNIRVCGKIVFVYFELQIIKIWHNGLKRFNNQYICVTNDYNQPVRLFVQQWRLRSVNILVYIRNILLTLGWPFFNDVASIAMFSGYARWNIIDLA